MSEFNRDKMKQLKKNGKYLAVLARKNQDGNYCQSNVFFREPLTEHEKLTGLEEWCPDEPLNIPLSPDELTERSMLDKNHQAFFDIWKRMLWRCNLGIS